MGGEGVDAWSCAIHASGALLRAIAAAPVDGCTQPALPFSCSLLPLSTLWLCAPPFCGTAFTNSLDNVRMIVTFISTTMVAHYGGTQEQTIVLKIQGNHRFAKPDTTNHVDNNCPG